MHTIGSDGLDGMLGVVGCAARLAGFRDDRLTYPVHAGRIPQQDTALAAEKGEGSSRIQVIVHRDGIDPG